MPAYDEDGFDWGGSFGPGRGDDDYSWLSNLFGGGGDNPDPGGPGTPPVVDDDPAGPGVTTPNPYENWGGGAGGDGPGATDITEGSSVWNSIEKGLGLAVGGLKTFLSATGLTLKDLLGITAGTAATVNANRMSKEGVAAIQKATGESKDLATKAMATVTGNYKPYMDTGVKSNADLYAMVGNSNLSGKFDQNIPKFTALPSHVGGVSLADLAQYRR